MTSMYNNLNEISLLINDYTRYFETYTVKMDGMRSLVYIEEII